MVGVKGEKNLQSPRKGRMGDLHGWELGQQEDPHGL